MLTFLHLIVMHDIHTYSCQSCALVPIFQSNYADFRHGVTLDLDLTHFKYRDGGNAGTKYLGQRGIYTSKSRPTRFGRGSEIDIRVRIASWLSHTRYKGMTRRMRKWRRTRNLDHSALKLVWVLIMAVFTNLVPCNFAPDPKGFTARYLETIVTPSVRIIAWFVWKSTIERRTIESKYLYNTLAERACSSNTSSDFHPI